MSTTSNSTDSAADDNYSGGLIRVNKRKDYRQDASLSWEARGVLAYLFSHGDKWLLRTTDLIRQGPAGKDKMYRILAELEEKRYYHREKLRRPDGSVHWILEVYNDPEANPHPEKPIDTKRPIGRTISGFTGDGGAIYGKPGDISLKENHDININKKEKDTEAEIQELGLIIKVDLGGTGDQARLARQLYFEHRDELSLREIAERAMGE